MTGHEVMDPPFIARWEAIGFVLLLVIFLLLPIGLSKSGLIRRQDVYPTVPTKAGTFPYIQHEIFNEQTDIDVLILGTSLLWVAIDTPYLQRELSKALGRDAKVITFGSNWRGEDLNYTLLRDLLQRRKVKLLVFSMPAYYQLMDEPHNQSSRWMLYGEEEAALSDLPLRQRVALYGEAVLGAPRHLLSKVRSNQLGEAERAAVLGANIVERGFNGAAFVRRELPPPNLTREKLIYSTSSASDFRFTGQPLSSYQMHFLRRAFNLLNQYHVPVALVHVPLSIERHKTVVEERMFWPEVFGMEMSIVGVPPATLFKGLSDAEIDQLYYDEHLNANGNQLFTRTITPALVEIYAQHQQPAR